MIYSRLAPPTVEIIGGVTTFTDPSWHWPARKGPSQAHVQGNATRRQMRRENDPLVQR